MIVLPLDYLCKNRSYVTVSSVPLPMPQNHSMHAEVVWWNPHLSPIGEVPSSETLGKIHSSTIQTLNLGRAYCRI